MLRLLTILAVSGFGLLTQSNWVLAQTPAPPPVPTIVTPPVLDNGNPSGWQAQTAPAGQAKLPWSHYLGSWQPIPDPVWQAMRGRSWHAHLRCPKRGQLALLSIPHVNYQGQRQTGQMIVARDVADDVLQAFAMIFEAGFPIERMQLVHRYGGNDGRSMAANNTSAFNCRAVSGGRVMSQHSLGRAIDINPIQNPFVRRGRAQPAAGRPFASPKDRKKPARGLIRRGDIVTTAFRRIGWKWGGKWRSSKDYQHFSQSGR